MALLSSLRPTSNLSLGGKNKFYFQRISLQRFAFSLGTNSFSSDCETGKCRSFYSRNGHMYRTKPEWWEGIELRKFLFLFMACFLIAKHDLQWVGNNWVSLVTQLVKKKSICNAGDPGLISGSGRSTGEAIGYPLQCSWASLGAQMIKNPPTMQEAWIQFLGWEDPLEEGSGYPLQYSVQNAVLTLICF